MATATNDLPPLAPEEHRKNLLEILRGSRFGMLMTRSTGGRIAGRPMSVARIDDDGTLYMVTGIESSKAAELIRDPNASVTVQSGDGFAIIEGEASLIGDRALIDSLWEPAWKVWFPNGKEDPDITIIVLRPIEGTYWSGGVGHGLSYVYRMLKARLQGEEMELKPDDMGKVHLRH